MDLCLKIQFKKTRENELFLKTSSVMGLYYRTPELDYLRENCILHLPIANCNSADKDRQTGDGSDS